MNQIDRNHRCNPLDAFYDRHQSIYITFLFSFRVPQPGRFVLPPRPIRRTKSSPIYLPLGAHFIRPTFHSRICAPKQAKQAGNTHTHQLLQMITSNTGRSKRTCIYPFFLIYFPPLLPFSFLQPPRLFMQGLILAPPDLSILFRYTGLHISLLESY